MNSQDISSYIGREYQYGNGFLVLPAPEEYGDLTRIDKKKQKSSSDQESNEYKKPKPRISDKEGAKDVPSWAKGNRPYKSESGKDFAKRLMDEKFGLGNYDKGADSPFNKIKKWGDRSWE